MILRYKLVNSDQQGPLMCDDINGEYVKVLDLQGLPFEEMIRTVTQRLGIDYHGPAIAAGMLNGINEALSTEIPTYSRAQELFDQVQNMAAQFGCPAGIRTLPWLRSRLDILTKLEERVIEQAQKAEEENPWEEAVLAAARSANVPDADELSADDAVSALVERVQRTALNPRKSQGAKHLIESGRQEGDGYKRKVYYDEQWVLPSVLIDALETLHDRAKEAGFKTAFDALDEVEKLQEENQNRKVLFGGQVVPIGTVVGALTKAHKIAEDLGYSDAFSALDELEAHNEHAERSLREMGAFEEYEDEESGSDEIELAKGQVWFVKLPGGVSLTEMQINEISTATVVLKGIGEISPFAARYKIEDIEFVELL